MWLARTSAQLVVQELLERFPESCGAPQSAQLAAVQRFLAVNTDLKRLRRSIGAGIAAFDPTTATSPRGVFCVVRPICMFGWGSPVKDFLGTTVDRAPQEEWQLVLLPAHGL